MNAQVKVKAATINWQQPICTSHERPLIGRVEADRADGMKRVALRSLSKPTEAIHTVWFYGENGKRPRCTEPDFDLVNFDPSDNVIRIPLQDAS